MKLVLQITFDSKKVDSITIRRNVANTYGVTEVVELVPVKKGGSTN